MDLNKKRQRISLKCLNTWAFLCLETIDTVLGHSSLCLQRSWGCLLPVFEEVRLPDKQTAESTPARTSQAV